MEKDGEAWGCTDVGYEGKGEGRYVRMIGSVLEPIQYRIQDTKDRIFGHNICKNKIDKKYYKYFKKVLTKQNGRHIMISETRKQEK